MSYNSVIQKALSYILNLGYAPILIIESNDKKEEDVLLMIFKDNLSLVANINKFRKVVAKNISHRLDVRWCLDDNSLIQITVYKKEVL